MIALHKKRFAELCEQLDVVEATKHDVRDQLSRSNSVHVDNNLFINWKVKARNLLQVACGVDSYHLKDFQSYESKVGFSTNYDILLRLRAVFLAAKEDYEGGYLSSVKTLVQAEVFDSELEQASELLKSGYGSAAAVIAGVVLETALRDLCIQRGLTISKLDKMNADLAKAGVFSVLTQKRITALADIRNSAAHGHPEKFKNEDVVSMISDVERILRDYLA